ncbi:nuclear distribution protein PAC1 [Sporothrix schenckii ATCC 58251]|uniref:Nuclear distribution protein PAC1 n=1 Tax=Sporothrix schenckii (strain ATCC 58251 / de Perez 2211183) TaxID=1391915 RepID=U7PZG1_SPOS1|nr:nuclear distribution protein PAC1 [Sporothrix schenckii ATCC 58251]
MAHSLTGRQAEELHKSIIAYLEAHMLPGAASALRTETQLGEDVLDAATTKKYETLLEKKWTSVVRLQKKIMDLESRNSALQSELDSLTPDSLSKRNKDPASWLPKAPPRYTLESHRGAINCIAFHPVFSSVATGSDDYTIKIWDWEVGELERTVKAHTRAVLDVDFGGPRGNILMASCSSDLTIKIWDPLGDYKNIRTLAGHDHSVSAVRFIPSTGNWLVSASRDHTLKIWDVNTGFCLQTLQGHTAWVRDVAPTYDGRYLVSTGDDMTARLWDISSSPRAEVKATMIGHEHYNECCAVAPPTAYPHLAVLAGLKRPPPAASAAEFMATGSRDKTIKLWDARGICLRTLVGHDNWIRAIVFHPGGKYLLSVSDDKTLRCWDLSQEGKCVRVLPAHEQFISCLRWAPGIPKGRALEDSNGGAGTPNGEINGGGTPNGKSAAAGAAATGADAQIRCLIATGSIDMTLKIFAN